MLSIRSWLLPLAAVSVAVNALDFKNTDYPPKKYVVSSSLSFDTEDVADDTTYTLNDQNPWLTLDYGSEIGGWPYVEIDESSTGYPFDLEIKYSEMRDALKETWSDGP